MRLWFSLIAIAMLAPGAAAGEISEQRKSELTYLVRQDCGSCHGMSLRGGLGKPLLPADLSLLDREQVAAIILNGVPGRPMPPWQGLISQVDADWIAGALKQGDIQ